MIFAALMMFLSFQAPAVEKVPQTHFNLLSSSKEGNTFSLVCNGKMMFFVFCMPQKNGDRQVKVLGTSVDKIKERLGEIQSQEKEVSENKNDVNDQGEKFIEVSREVSYEDGVYVKDVTLHVGTRDLSKHVEISADQYSKEVTTREHPIGGDTGFDVEIQRVLVIDKAQGEITLGVSKSLGDLQEETVGIDILSRTLTLTKEGQIIVQISRIFPCDADCWNEALPDTLTFTIDLPRAGEAKVWGFINGEEGHWGMSQNERYHEGETNLLLDLSGQNTLGMMLGDEKKNLPLEFGMNSEGDFFGQVDRHIWAELGQGQERVGAPLDPSLSLYRRDLQNVSEIQKEWLKDQVGHENLMAADLKNVMAQGKGLNLAKGQMMDEGNSAIRPVSSPIASPRENPVSEKLSLEERPALHDAVHEMPSVDKEALDTRNDGIDSRR